MKKVVSIILVLSCLYCKQEENFNLYSHYTINIDSLDYGVDYLKNINNIITSTDTVQTETYMVEKDSIRYGYGGILWGSSDSINNVITRLDDWFYEYNSIGNIKNEYYIKHKERPYEFVTKLHYSYYKDKLVRVDYIKIEGKDTLLNHRKLYYDKDSNLYLEKINQLFCSELVVKEYENSVLTKINIFEYDNLVEGKLQKKINYYYHKNLLTKLKVHSPFLNITRVREYFYDEKGNIIKSKDSAFGKENLSKTSHHNFNEKSYKYDNIGRLAKITVTSEGINTIVKIIHPKNHHNLKIKINFHDNMGYFAQLRLN